jgi:phospholipase/carboxylesterase
MRDLQPSLRSPPHGGLHELVFCIKEPQPVQPKFLVVLLHGVGSSELSMKDLGDCLSDDTLVLMPRGPLDLGTSQAAWFRVAFTHHGPKIVEVEAESARQTLIRFIQQVQTEYNIAPKNSVIAGFSQGGIMSASVGLTRPDLVAGFGVLSGRILPELAPHIASSENLKDLKAFIGHGEFDNVLPVMWAEKSKHLLEELNVSFVSQRYPVEHRISSEMQADFLNWVTNTLKSA